MRARRAGPSCHVGTAAPRRAVMVCKTVGSHTTPIVLWLFEEVLIDLFEHVGPFDDNAAVMLNHSKRSWYRPLAMGCRGRPGSACSAVKYERETAVPACSSTSMAMLVVRCLVRGVPSS